MIYILETKLSESVSIYFALTKIYGLNKSQTFYFCKKVGFALNLKVFSLTEDQIFKLVKVIEKSKISLTSDLKKMNRFVIKNLASIKSYKGLRRLKGLPVRGQRTHTNAKTCRNNRFK